MKINPSHPLDEALKEVKIKGLDFIAVIVSIVCEESGLEPYMLNSKTRKREIVQARQIAMTLSTRMTRCSLAVIGENIGGKDHATVLHAKKNILGLTETDKKLRTLVIRCINRLVSFNNSSLVCSICGRRNILQKAWTDPNTLVFNNWTYEKTSSMITDLDCWCNDCQAHIKLITVKKYLENDELDRLETIPDSLQESN